MLETMTLSPFSIFCNVQGKRLDREQPFGQRGLTLVNSASAHRDLHGFANSAGAVEAEEFTNSSLGIFNRRI